MGLEWRDPAPPPVTVPELKHHGAPHGGGTGRALLHKKGLYEGGREQLQYEAPSQLPQRCALRGLPNPRLFNAAYIPLAYFFHFFRPVLHRSHKNN